MLKIVLPVIASIVILGGLEFSQDVYAFDASLVVEAGDTIDGKTLTFVSHPSISDNGQIVFRGSFSGGSGIFTPTSLVVETGDAIDGKTLTFVESPLINNNGDIIFVGTFTGGHGLFTPTSLLVKTGDTIDTKTLTFVSSPLINNNGDVIFRGSFAGGSGFFSPHELIFSTDLAAEGVLTFMHSPSFNDNREIVFRGQFEDDEVGILHCPCGEFPFDINYVVRVGDTATNGETLTDVYLPSINDDGDIIFVGEWSLDEWGIFTVDDFYWQEVCLNLVQCGDIFNISHLLVGGDFRQFVYEGDGIDDGVTHYSLHTGFGMVVGEGVELGGTALFNPRNPSINENGDIVFQANHSFVLFPIESQADAIFINIDTKCGNGTTLNRDTYQCEADVTQAELDALQSQLDDLFANNHCTPLAETIPNVLICITDLVDRVAELESLVGEKGSITLDECKDIRNTIEDKIADGKKISPKLQKDADLCDELYP